MSTIDKKGYRSDEEAAAAAKFDKGTEPETRENDSLTRFVIIPGPSYGDDHPKFPGQPQGYIIRTAGYMAGKTNDEIYQNGKNGLIRDGIIDPLLERYFGSFELDFTDMRSSIVNPYELKAEAERVLEILNSPPIQEKFRDVLRLVQVIEDIKTEVFGKDKYSD